jgi:hypothetical protein
LEFKWESVPGRLRATRPGHLPSWLMLVLAALPDSLVA